MALLEEVVRAAMVGLGASLANQPHTIGVGALPPFSKGIARPACQVTQLQ